MYFFCYYLLLASLPLYTHANVEKTIFRAPNPATIPSSVSVLDDDLGLERLSPLDPVLRTRLNASFPSETAPLGTESWFFLENLNPGQRYEVRICYLATQPTIFTLKTHTLAETIETPSLLASLSKFSSTQLAHPGNPGRRTSTHRSGATDPAPTSDSVLFLRIHAAAEYFTVEKELMENVPPVMADIILDAYVMNVFPRSLVPTAGWGVVVAGMAVVIGKWVVRRFGGLVEDVEGEEGMEKKKK